MEQTFFECSNCEDFGESSFSSYQNYIRNTPPKVWIKNLPEGLTETGVENICLFVGKPHRITYNPKRHIASVEFESWREVELAVQHLDSVPPYYLKVEFSAPKLQYNNKDKEPCNCAQEKFSTPELNTIEKEKISNLNVSGQEKVSEELNEKDNEEVTNRIILKNINYDPSLKMRQRNLDFETESSSVSYGRGFLYMGNTDRFVGGLKKFECSSENGVAKNQMKYYCENCEALTTKCCKACSASYCSKTCLNSTENNHIKNCKISDKELSHSAMSKNSSFSLSSSNNSLLQVPLTLGCTVVIATYLSMRTVFVRRSDEFWEEKFSRLINDVALAALKGEKLTSPPKQGDLVIAKYYKDFCYYRARVCSDAVGEQIQLFFIDFGNSQETDVKDLKLLPDHLMFEPAFAVKVHLKGITNESSIDSVNYYNKLTAESVPLILRFDESIDEVVLIEKDSSENVNKTVLEHSQPSWKKDKSVLLKSGEVYYLSAIKQQPLEEGKTYDLFLSHFSEQEFFDSEVFWVMNISTDEFYHANSQMQEKINEYCEFLKDDYYMPRDRELCLAKEKGKWHRCVNLKSCKTTCCLFFLDDGHSSLFETKNIRKMIEDFIETPAQAICCTLPGDPNLKSNKELQAKAVKFLKESVGRTMLSVQVLKKMGDAYCLSVPEINK